MNRREAIKQTTVLMGSVLTPGLVGAVLDGCTVRKKLNWAPVFLTKDESVVAGQIAERIIPRTETPGALEVGVDQFIDTMLARVYSAEDGKTYKQGLEKIDRISKDLHQRKFINLNAEEKDEVLKKLEHSKEKVFSISKELTLIGYFTSEMGMKSNFEYRPIPGSYDPCISYAPGDKVWIGNQVFNK